MKKQKILTPTTSMKESIRNVTANPAVFAPRLAKFLCSRRSLGYAPLIFGSSQVDYWNSSPFAEGRAVIIGERLRELRQQRKLSQRDIEKRTGLLCCYTSLVENGHTVPAVETLEKFARALEVPMYQLFYDGEEPPKLPKLPKRKSANGKEWGDTGKDARSLYKFRRFLSRMEEKDRTLLMFMAQKMAKTKPV